MEIGRKYLAPALIGAALVLGSGYDARAEQVETTQPAGIERVVEKEKESKNNKLVGGLLLVSGMLSLVGLAGQAWKRRSTIGYGGGGIC